MWFHSAAKLGGKPARSERSMRMMSAGASANIRPANGRGPRPAGATRRMPQSRAGHRHAAVGRAANRETIFWSQRDRCMRPIVAINCIPLGPSRSLSSVLLDTIYSNTDWPQSMSQPVGPARCLPTGCRDYVGRPVRCRVHRVRPLHDLYVRSAGPQPDLTDQTPNMTGRSPRRRTVDRHVGATRSRRHV